MKTQRKLAIEASRGALITMHSAAGLACSTECGIVVRLLRAAEGMIRSAVVALTSSESVVVHRLEQKPLDAAGRVDGGRAPRRRSRQKAGKQEKEGLQQRSKAPDGMEATPTDVGEEDESRGTAAVAAAVPETVQAHLQEDGMVTSPTPEAGETVAKWTVQLAQLLYDLALTIEAGDKPACGWNESLEALAPLSDRLASLPC